ncbi:hypothetical protein PLESTM_000648100 [Pleodorina starrii]|nr:hypothetical protein PLESTM_000648100 [Pleodorina starrii]
MLKTGASAPWAACQQAHRQQLTLRGGAWPAMAPGALRAGQARLTPMSPQPHPHPHPRGRPPASTPPLQVQIVEEASDDPATAAAAASAAAAADATAAVTVRADAADGQALASAAVGQDDVIDVDIDDGGGVVAVAAPLGSVGPGQDPVVEEGAAAAAAAPPSSSDDGPGVSVGSEVPLAAAAAAAAAETAAPPAGEPLAPHTRPHVTSEAALSDREVEPAAEAEPPTPPPPPLRRAPEVDLPLAALVNGTGTAAAAASRPPPRPFPPPLDLQRLGEALLGEPTIGPVFNELFALSRNRQPSTTSTTAAAASGGPLLYAPRFPRPADAPPASTLPLLVYLPGIDGTGLAAYRQFPGLSARFDLRGVFLPPEDRTSFQGLVESLAQQLEEEVASLEPSRPVYLLGESFGGLLALALAQRLSCVDRLVLVNPATSFDRSPWPSLGPLLPALPPDIYRLLPVALAPLLSNPLAMAAWGSAPTDPLPRQAVDLLYGLLDLLPELSSLRVVLPPDTLAWRLQLLRQGAEQVNSALGKVRQRTLLLVGESDLVIPSASEAPRLQAALPRCRSRLVRGGSHALLQEASMNLAAVLQEEDFYVPRRRLTRPHLPSSSSSSSTSHRSPNLHPRPPPGGANFGSPGPLELPTPGEVRRAVEAGGLSTLRRLVSPVFLSTDAASGRVGLGLGALPAPGSGPVLFVGNHQLFAPDMPLMVAHFLEERGQLLRGLAHPMAMGMRAQASSSAGGGPNPTSSPSLSPNSDPNPNPASFGRFLETFGAVPVSGRNLYTLLQGGEAALLYPGGAREAFKLRGEQYELIWPRRAEFVRMASKLGATIVPFAAVGAEDSVELLLDRRDLQGTPLLGQWLRRQEGSFVPARRGVSVSEEVEDSLIAPLAAPKPPARFYFLFGAPIRTDPRAAGDRAAMDELYGRVRSDVERCLGYLLRKREQDPFKELGPRLLYEASWGGRRQAPTFKP